MKHFPPGRQGGQRTLMILLWLCLWQAAAFGVGNYILLAGPIQVFKELVSLLPQKAFWLSILMSFQKISAGFLAAFFAGILMGRLAFSLPVLKEFLAPAMAFVKSVPVASFVILALIWAGSKNLSVLISFLVVFPIIYTNTIAGLAGTDKDLLEMAQVFGIKGWRKFAGLYWPALLPYLLSGCKIALGMSWKSGIAAEVIGVPEHTIGEQLYLSKIYLDTAGLLAWTLVIIAVSAAFEKLFLSLLNQTGKGRLFLPPKPSAGNILPPEDLPLGGAKNPDGKNPNGKSLDGKSPDGKTLTVTRLSKSFGSLPVLKEASFSFTSLKPCCIMGASGSGKTTWLRILLSLEAADTGSVQALPAAAVFQENRLCEQFSPIDNMRLAVPGLSREEIIRQLSRLLPEECLTRPVSTLSGGMKRRTAIARALLAPAEMIVMDEPFTGLDEGTKEKVIRYILEKSKGKLLILSTHQEEDVRLIGGKRFDL